MDGHMDTRTDKLIRVYIRFAGEWKENEYQKLKNSFRLYNILYLTGIQ